MITIAVSSSARKKRLSINGGCLGSSSSLGDRIVSAGTEWVAPPDAADCEPATSWGAGALERLDGIDGAARIITARRRKQVAERYLVTPHTQHQERPHHVSADAGGIGVLGGGADAITTPCHRLIWMRARSKSDASSGNDAPYASGRMRITTSAARSKGRSRVRDSSRSRRLTRFLATAVCRWRG